GVPPAFPAPPPARVRPPVPPPDGVSPIPAPKSPRAAPVAVAPSEGPSEFRFQTEPQAWMPAPFAPDIDLQIQALGSLIRTHPSQVIPLLKQIALDSQDASEARR